MTTLHRVSIGAFFLAMILGLDASRAVERENAAAVDKGKILALKGCQTCHAIDGSRGSPMPDAPGFSTLAQKSPGENLEKILTQGLMTPHAPMPYFLVNSENLADLAAYLSTVQLHQKAGGAANSGD